MRKEFTRPVVAFVALGILLFACSNEPTAPPIDEEGDEMVSSLLSQLNAGGVAGAAALSSGGSTAAPSDTSKAPSPKNCPFDAATDFFVCAAQTLPNGMSLALSFQLLDAANAPQSKFDTLTVSLRRVTDMTGSISQPIQTPNGPVPATHTMAQHDDMVITGFRTNTPEQNGSGTMNNTIVPEGMPTGTVTATRTVAGLRFDPSPTAPKYPTAGTITSVVTSQQGSGPSFTSTQVTTYDGTAIATTVITMPNGGTRTCTYDMTQKDVPPACSTAP